MILLPNQDTFGRMQISSIDEIPNIIDESTDGTIYIGYAKRGTLFNEPSWRIKKIQTIDSITTIGYVNGVLNYNFIWNDRISYTYL